MLPLSDSHPAGRFPFWVVLIIVINVYVFWLELTASNPDAFINTWGLVPANVDFSNWVSLIPFFSSQFLHGGFIHIISNMLFLWVFGDNVEADQNFLIFPFFYLLAGFVGGFIQYLLNPDSIIPMIGASGAVAGVLGAYFARFPHHSIKTLVIFFGFISIINIPAGFMLIYWFITQIFAGTFSLGVQTADTGGVAYFAHIGGFAAGWILGKIFGRRTNKLNPID